MFLVSILEREFCNAANASSAGAAAAYDDRAKGRLGAALSSDPNV